MGYVGLRSGDIRLLLRCCNSGQLGPPPHPAAPGPPQACMEQAMELQGLAVNVVGGSRPEGVPRQSQKASWKRQEVGGGVFQAGEQGTCPQGCP